MGDKTGHFQRTGNFHVLAVEPPAPTVLKKLVDEKTVMWFLSVKLRISTLTKNKNNGPGCPI
jgi:hypothetical protein